jgi:anion-transporting  ArsA/GET3 family ATPase
MGPGQLDLRFIVVAGKGGVGKSVVAAALAKALAARGKRVLVAMCNARERLSYLLQTDPIGPQIRTLEPGLDAVNMEPGAALEEYGMLVLKVRALYKLIFGNRLVASFLRGTPGIEAWAMLGKAQHHAFELLPDGRARYDTVIVDAPATGHGLELLRVPKVIMDVAPPGLLRREAERAWGLFTDPARAGVLIVTMPEELPTNETIDLYRAVHGELRLPVCGLVANMVWPVLFEPSDAALLGALRARHGTGDALGPLLDASTARLERETRQRECLARLAREVPVPIHPLPHLFSADVRRAEIETLATLLRGTNDR